MIVFGYYDRDGNPIPDRECWRLMADQSYKRVAEDTVGPYWISTVWLGLDHGFTSGGPPIIFETMVFADTDTDLTLDLECRRYSTLDEAMRGHVETVLLVTATTQLGVDELDDDHPTTRRKKTDG